MKLNEILKNKKHYSIGFIGGSITEGAGSSSKEKCFASLVTTNLEKKFSDTEFTCINAGIGGTGSSLGLFRLHRDLLSQNPDIVFIEFAVNDYSLKSTGIYVENMIRQIKAHNSKTEIVLIYTATKTMLEEYQNDSIPESVKQHMQLSEYYGIPQINMGYESYKNSQMSIDDFCNTYTTDSVHPNDAGYQKLTEIILNSLEKADFISFISDKPFLFNRELKNPRLIMCENFANDTWKLSYNTMYNKLPNYIYSYTPGDEFSFEFDGSFLGIYYTVEKDSGIMEYSVDNGEWKECSNWDKYALQFNRPHSLILEENLSDSHHNVKIRNSNKKDEKSEGHYIRLGAFMVG